MVFGDIISSSEKSIELVTADNNRFLVDSKLKKFAIRIFGIPHTEMRNRVRLIFRDLKVETEDKILDAGCGIGLYGMTLAKKFKCEVKGIDIDKSKIENAKKIAERTNIQNIDFTVGDITKIVLKEKFDLIICSDVLEHIKNDEKALKELSRVLNNSGTIIITVPFKNKHNAETMEEFGHVREGYTIDWFKEFAQRDKLKIEYFTGYTYFFGKLAWKINNFLFKYPAIAAITFYPVYCLTFLDFTKIGEPNGLFVKLKKTNN